MRLQSVERKRTFCGLVIINFINSSRPSLNFLGVLVAHFSKTIGWMVIWRRFYMCYSIEFHECFKFITGKICSVIRDNDIWNAMSGRHFCQFWFWQKETNFCSKIGPARSVLAAKVVQVTTLACCFATFGPARPILVGTNFGGLKIFPEWHYISFY